MNTRAISHILIAVGILLLFLSLLLGNAKFGIFIIFPFVYGYGILPAVSFLIIMIGIFLFFLQPSRMEYPESQLEGEAKKRRHFGGVILIGPLPIIFGSDRNMLIVSLLATILILLAIFIFLVLIVY